MNISINILYTYVYRGNSPPSDPPPSDQRRAEGPSLTNINSIRMSVCLDVCLLAISSGGNSDEAMYRIPIDVEFMRLGPNLYFKSVRPTVRTPVAENRTVVEENYQKSTFFRGFRKN